MKLIWVIIVILITLVTIINFGSNNFNKVIKKEIKQLTSNMSNPAAKVFTYADIKELPEPVQRYFKFTLKEGQTYIRFVRLKQTGLFRTKPEQNFMPIKAEQYFTTEKPAFIWKATANPTSFIWIGVRDKYYQGKGNMLVKLFSSFTLANAKGKEIDISSLIRFLSEAPWFPTALLPSDYLEWIAIDSNSAMAVITDGQYTASVIFTFNERGEIIKLSTKDRYMDNDGQYSKEEWICHYNNYQEINGVKIPIEGEVDWNLPKGTFNYAKLKVTDIQYDNPFQ
ncbi:MAG: DUF6544 family protein [Bacillota bacterium]